MSSAKRGAQYEDYAFAFVDILGFRHLVETADCDEIERSLRLLRSQTTHGRIRTRNTIGKKLSDREVVGIKTVSFSDNVCVMKVVEDSPLDAMLELVAFLKQAQFKLAVRGVWIRGGLTVGSAYHKQYDGALDGSSIFGPALVEAYLIESKVAKYPRIVVDEKMAVEMLAAGAREFQHDEWRSEIVNLNEVIRRDRDGVYFIDYASEPLLLWAPLEDHFFGLTGKSTLTPDDYDPGAEFQKNLNAEGRDRISANAQRAFRSATADVRVQEKHKWTIEYLESSVPSLTVGSRL